MSVIISQTRYRWRHPIRTFFSAIGRYLTRAIILLFAAAVGAAAMYFKMTGKI
jgi:hypothetical protein